MKCSFIKLLCRAVPRSSLVEDAVSASAISAVEPVCQAGPSHDPLQGYFCLKEQVYFWPDPNTSRALEFSRSPSRHKTQTNIPKTHVRFILNEKWQRAVFLQLRWYCTNTVRTRAPCISLLPRRSTNAFTRGPLLGASLEAKGLGKDATTEQKQWPSERGLCRARTHPELDCTHHTDNWCLHP